jgi:hypothetical protein
MFSDEISPNQGKVYVVNMTWLTIRKTFVTNVEIYKLTEFPNDLFFI